MIVRLAFIAAHVGNHSIRLLYRVPGVSRSWFHSWQRTLNGAATGTSSLVVGSFQSGDSIPLPYTAAARVAENCPELLYDVDASIVLPGSRSASNHISGVSLV